jgi:RimJ/RimL family protein N-acetyltransferase
MIKGTRVLFRPVEEGDLELLVRWRNDPQNSRFVFSPFLINPGGQKKWYEALLANPNKVMFMVDNLEGKTVGMIGLDHIDWRNQECEGGPIVFDPGERSYGYAEEAIGMLIKYAFEELNMHRMYAFCYPYNRIIELMKWFGFKEEGVLRQAVFSEGKFQDKVILGLLREEWQNDESIDAINDR